MNQFLDQRQTRCLQLIIETGSVRGAAEAMSLDPSVVSRTVAKLERDVGMTLLERRGRGVVPTDTGRLFAQYAKRQQDLNHAFLTEINNLKSAQQGHIEIALGEGFVDLVLQPLLEGFMQRHPSATFKIQVAGTVECMQLILEDLTHIGFAFQPPNDVRLRSHFSRQSPFRVHVRKDHPLARRRRALTLSDLVSYQGATLLESFGVRKNIQTAEQDEHVVLKNMVYTNSFKVLWQFVSMGLGYVMTPGSVPPQGNQPTPIVSLPLVNPILNNSRIHILTRAGRHLPPITEKLLQHVVKKFPQL